MSTAATHRGDRGTAAAPLRVSRVAAIVALAATASAWAGCFSFWDRVRERQRLSSIALSREFVERGSCARALQSLEHAQTRRWLGDFAAESIWLEAHCLGELGREEESLAHWRLLADQYRDTPWAERIPDAVRPALGAAEPYRARAAPAAFEIPTPRYGEGARRASIAGAIWLEYRLDASGRPHDLRVVGHAHPLLAKYAVEAVMAGRWRRSAGAGTALPRRAGSVFRFESPWMDEAESEPQTGGSEAEPALPATPAREGATVPDPAPAPSPQPPEDPWPIPKGDPWEGQGGEDGG